jgi:hypothetical protein
VETTVLATISPSSSSLVAGMKRPDNLGAWLSVNLPSRKRIIPALLPSQMLPSRLSNMALAYALGKP